MQPKAAFVVHISGFHPPSVGVWIAGYVCSQAAMHAVVRVDEHDVGGPQFASRHKSDLEFAPLIHHSRGCIGCGNWEIAFYDI
jgi:hypothetical protein